jgi:hypothetical protein
MPDVVEITLAKTECVAVIDATCFEARLQFTSLNGKKCGEFRPCDLKWRMHVGNSGRGPNYATAAGGRHDFNVLLHRLVAQAPAGVLVDHRDRNGLNNTTDNLRLCSHSENLRNSKKRAGARSQYKGVLWQSESSRWFARGWLESGNRKQRLVSLGTFETEIEAAIAYDIFAREFLDEFAAVNFPGECLVAPRRISNPKRKLSSEDAAAIRVRLKDGESRNSISERFGISLATISDIVCGKRWAVEDIYRTDERNAG